MRPYVGKTSAGRYVSFRSDVRPTEDTHGDRFAVIVGPFETVRGARMYALLWNRGLPATMEGAEAVAAEVLTATRSGS